VNDFYFIFSSSLFWVGHFPLGALEGEMAFPGDVDCIDESYIRLRPGEESLAETVAQSAHFEKDRSLTEQPQHGGRHSIFGAS
jgi:hypothetical protein